MSGVKGRSGGARPGAGRKAKPKPPAVMVPTETDMLELLQKVAGAHGVIADDADLARGEYRLRVGQHVVQAHRTPRQSWG